LTPLCARSPTIGTHAGAAHAQVGDADRLGEALLLQLLEAGVDLTPPVFAHDGRVDEKEVDVVCAFAVSGGGREAAERRTEADNLDRVPERFDHIAIIWELDHLYDVIASLRLVKLAMMWAHLGGDVDLVARDL
jgi:hypothetical protein